MPPPLRLGAFTTPDNEAGAAPASPLLTRHNKLNKNKQGEPQKKKKKMTLKRPLPGPSDEAKPAGKKNGIILPIPSASADIRAPTTDAGKQTEKNRAPAAGATGIFHTRRVPHQRSFARRRAA